MNMVCEFLELEELHKEMRVMIELGDGVIEGSLLYRRTWSHGRLYATYKGMVETESWKASNS